MIPPYAKTIPYALRYSETYRNAAQQDSHDLHAKQQYAEIKLTSRQDERERIASILSSMKKSVKARTGVRAKACGILC